MDNSAPRRLRNGRRIPLNVALDPTTHKELKKIAGGNRSAAIEKLVFEHLERQRILEPVT